MVSHTVLPRILSGMRLTARPLAHAYQIQELQTRSLTFARHILDPSITGYKIPRPSSSATPAKLILTDELGASSPTYPPKYTPDTAKLNNSPPASHHTQQQQRQQRNSKPKHNNSSTLPSENRTAPNSRVYASLTDDISTSLGATTTTIKLPTPSELHTNTPNTLICNQCSRLLRAGEMSHEYWPGCFYRCQAKQARDAEEDAVRAEEEFAKSTTTRGSEKERGAEAEAPIYG